MRCDEAEAEGRECTDQRKAVGPSHSSPGPAAWTPPIARERVVQQFEEVIGDWFRCDRAPELPKEPRGDGDEQEPAPVVQHDIQGSYFVCHALARLHDGRAGVAVREIENRDDVVWSGRDKLCA